jgi:hypothetical protein
MLKNTVFSSSTDTKKWFTSAAIRAVKTVAQTAVAMLPVATTISAVDWKSVVGTAALAGLTSILTSIVGLPETNNTAENTESEES